MNRYVIRKWFRTTGWRVAHEDESVGLMTERDAVTVMFERRSENSDKMVKCFELSTEDGNTLLSLPA